MCVEMSSFDDGMCHLWSFWTLIALSFDVGEKHLSRTF